MGRKKKNILGDIRESISPRKRRNDDSQKVKGYAFIRVPESLKRDLDVLKMAYEIMWSDRGDPSKLSTDELETWEMQRMTQEEFFRRLYQGALRIDPEVKGYLSRAKAAYDSVEGLGSRARAAAEKAIRSFERLSRENGTSVVDEARRAQEEARKSLEMLRAGTPHIDQHSPVDPKIADMAGTVAVPTEQELQEDPRLQEAFGEKVKGKERHELQYFFVKGEERLPARFSKGEGSFAVTFEERPHGFTYMANRGWHLEDELGEFIDEKTAMEIKMERVAYLNRPSDFSLDPDISDEDMAEFLGMSIEKYRESKNG